jgi:hypothetical protein
MVINVSESQVHLAIIAVLFVLQVYQFHLITKNKGEIAKLWMQVAMLALSLATKINEDNEKEKGTR